MATRSHFSRLLRRASHALASHSAANTRAAPRQCHALVRTPQTRSEVGSFTRLIDGRRMFASAPHEEDGSDEDEWEEDDDDDDELALEALESDSDSDDDTTNPPRKAKEAEYSMRIEAPIDEIYALLHSRGFISAKQKRPTPNDSVLGHEDHRIVAWYQRVSVGLLNYYACCDNLLKVKAMVNYQLRWSCIHTLSKKHKSSSRQVIQKYGKNLAVTQGEGKAVVASFLSVEEIKKHRKGFLDIDPVPPATLIDVLFTRMKRRSKQT